MKIKKICLYLNVHILIHTHNEMIIVAYQISIFVSSQLPPFILCILSMGGVPEAPPH